MVNLETKQMLLKQFDEIVEANMKENCSDLDMAGMMASDNVNLTKECVIKIKNNVLAALPVGVSVPRISIYQSCSGTDDGITLNVITVTNCISSDIKFKYQFAVTRTNPVEVVKDFLKSIYKELIEDSLIRENLEVVNDVLEQAVEKAGISYKVKIVSPMGNYGKKIAFMSDDEIHFVADSERVFELDDILVLRDADDIITDEMIMSAFNNEVEAIAEAQTPEQLVDKRGGMLVKYVCDIRKSDRPMTMIKKVTNKNAMSKRGNKDAIMYFKDGDVFSLVARRDGNMEVLLSPFDIKTFRKVDFDVLEKING